MNNLIKTVKDKNTFLGLALACYVADVALDAFSYRFAKIIDFMPFEWFSALIPVFFLSIYFLLGSKENFARLKPFLAFILSLSFILIITYLIRPEYKYWYFEYERGVLNTLLRPDSGIFAILYFSIFKKDEKRLMLDYLSLGVWAILIYRLLQYIKAIINGYWLNTGGSGTDVQLSYSLEFGYSVSFITLFFIFRGIISKNRLQKYGFYILSFGTFLMLFGNGSRGALLPTVAFLTLLAIQALLRYKHSRNAVEKTDHSTIKAKSRLMLFFLVIAIVFTSTIIAIEGSKILRPGGFNLFYQTQATDASGQLVGEPEEFGGNRTLLMLSSDNFFSDNGRFKIYREVWSSLKENLFTGLGIYGDRPIVSQILVFGYCHSIILEFWVNYGIVIGTLLLLAFVFISFRMIFVEPNRLLSLLYTVFFASSMELLLSSSYWRVLYPWVCIIFYFQFSDLWVKDRQRIRLITQKISCRIKSVFNGFIIVALVLVLLFSSVNYYHYHKEYRSKRIQIDTPTVILTFDNFSPLDMTIIEYLSNNGIKGTMFLNADLLTDGEDNMDNPDIRFLTDRDWDVQANLAFNKSLSDTTREEMRADIENIDLYAKTNNLNKPIALGFTSGYLSLADRKFLSDYYSIIRLKARPIAEGKYGLAHIDKETLLGLYSLNVSVSSFDPFNDDGYIIKQIDSACSDDNLLVLRFDSSNVPVSKSTAYFESFISIVNVLKEKGFVFITLTELYDEYVS